MNQKYRNLVGLMISARRQEMRFEYVDYIQGDGNQYINTLFSPQDNNFKVTLELMLTASSSQTIGIWGNIIFRPSVAKNSIGIVSNKWFVGQGGTTMSTDNAIVGVKTELVFDMINATFTANDQSYSVQRLTGNSSSAFLFARNDGYNEPYLGKNFSGRVYKCIVETSEGIIQHLRPVRLIDLDEYCLRCEITGKFYRNVGTGRFNYTRSADEEVEYIESTEGLSYVDTKFVPRKDSGKTKLVVSMSSMSSLTGIYGYINRSSISNRITIGAGLSEDVYKWFAGAGSTNYFSEVILNQKIEIIWDRKNKLFTIDEVEFPCPDLNMSELNLTAYLFNRNNNNSPDNPYGFVGKLYSYQELDDANTLLLDAVPVIFGGSYCLKDKLTNSYLYNLGEQEFIGPKPIGDYKLTNYTQLTQEQWFGLDIKGSNTDSTEVVFKTDYTIGGFIFGARDGYLINSMSAFANLSGSNTIVFSGFGNKWGSKIISNTNTDGWISLKQDTNTVSINDVVYSVINTQVYTTNDDVMVGRILSDDRTFEGYIRSLKIRKENKLVYDFHSCIQVSTGIAGFWCFATNRFYGSETGIEFIAGPEIDDGDKTELLKYLDYSDQFNEINYTTASWSYFSSKKIEATKVNNEKNLQQTIDVAADNLLNAMKNLVEVSSATPEYEISNLTLDGTNYESTDIKLFESNKDFTLFVDFEIDESNYSRGQTVLFHCMYEVSPWPGLTFQTITDPSISSGEYTLSYNTDTTEVYKPVATDRSNILTRSILCVRNRRISETESQINVKTFKPLTVNTVDDINSDTLVYDDTVELRTPRLIIGAADMLDQGIIRNTIGKIYKFEYYESEQLTDEQLLLKFLKQV